MKRCSRVWAAVLPALIFLIMPGALPLRAQTEASAQWNFLADKYEVSTYVDTAAQGINAVAKVTFRAQQVSSNIRVELNENLEIREIKGPDGKNLTFERENQNPLYVMILLPSQVPAGKEITLTFSYGGLLANEENSPVPNLKALMSAKNGRIFCCLRAGFP